MVACVDAFFDVRKNDYFSTYIGSNEKNVENRTSVTCFCLFERYLEIFRTEYLGKN